MTIYSLDILVTFQVSKPVLEKAEEPETKLPTSAGSSKKQESSRKTSISAFLTMPKPLSVWITINCGKFWKRWEYQTTWPASWEICMQVRKQQLELDMEEQTSSKCGVYIYTYTYTCIYTIILLSHKKGWNIAICSNMDELRVYHTKWSNRGKQYYVICHLHVESKK